MEQVAEEFARLMERVRAGCPDATRQMFDRYGPHVLRVVRRLLQRRLRRRYDSIDFAQSVWASFFRVPAERYSFASPAALVAFLSRVAYNKVKETTRQRLQTGRHDLTRECSLDEPAEAGLPEPMKEKLPARVNTPSQYVIADERWQKLVRGLPPGHRRVLELLREGHSHIDISRQLGIDRKIIQRLLDQLRRHADAP
jgi:RNA polymerase sigma factor (sigma-70 family)